MNLLPYWNLTNPRPAIFDHDSGTAIEMVAKVYGAMNELIEEYNKFAADCNESITEFATGTNKNLEVFQTAMNQKFQDFIDTIELKYAAQDKELADAVTFMKGNITEAVKLLMQELKESGEISEAITESLSYMDSKIQNVANEMAQAIEAEAQARAQAIQEATEAEAQARAQAIEAEAQARAQAIEAEAQARAQAINAGLVAEAQARTEAIAEMDKRRFIFIADSYGVKTSERTVVWTELTRDFMAIAEADCYINANNGAGFAGFSSTNKTFLNTLEDLIAANPTMDKTTITDVVVAGGYNDNYKTSDEIRNAIKLFCDFVKNNFPKATVHIGMVGANNNGVYLGGVAKIYADSSVNANANYMTGVENSLNNSAYLIADGFHPNDAGALSIAMRISNVLKSGAASVLQWQDVTFKAINNTNTFAASQMQQEEQILIKSAGSGVLSFATPLSISRNLQPTVLFEATTHVLFTAANEAIYIPALVSFYIGGKFTEMKPCFLQYSNKYLSLVYGEMTTDGTGYESELTINGIVISPFQQSASSLFNR